MQACGPPHWPSLGTQHRDQTDICSALHGVAGGDSTSRSVPAWHAGWGPPALAVQTSSSAALPSWGHRQLPPKPKPTEALPRGSSRKVCFPNSEEAWPRSDFPQHLVVLGGRGRGRVLL